MKCLLEELLELCTVFVVVQDGVPQAVHWSPGCSAVSSYYIKA